jgi:hypothetical protein
MAGRAVESLLPDDPVFHFGQPQLFIRIPLNSQAVDVLQRGALGDDNPGHLRADINTQTILAPASGPRAARAAARASGRRYVVPTLDINPLIFHKSHP